MRSVYVIAISLFILLSFASFYVANNPTQLITGHAIFNHANPVNEFTYDDVYFQGGDLNGCFAYSQSCPIPTTEFLFVGNEFELGLGAHASVTGNGLTNRLCCVGLLTPGGLGFRHDDVISLDEGAIGGGHVFVGAQSTTDIDSGSNFYFADSDESCKDGYACAFVASRTGQSRFAFNDSHVWNCSYEDPEFVKACYEQIPISSDCSASSDFEQPCTNEGIGLGLVGVGADQKRLYCSFGETTDEEDGPGALSPGHCCATGQYWQPDVFGTGGSCIDSKECGFDEDPLTDEDTCILSQGNTINPATKWPFEYMGEEYFLDDGCVDWTSFQDAGEWVAQSCCFNVTKHFHTGNYMCQVESTP